MTPYYEDDLATIYHGDCREVDAWLQADVLVTDPPYGLDVALNSGGKAGRVTPKEARVIPEWDRSLAGRDEALEMWGDRPALVFASVTKPPPRWLLSEAPHLGQGRGGRDG